MLAQRTAYLKRLKDRLDAQEAAEDAEDDNNDAKPVPLTFSQAVEFDRVDQLDDEEILEVCFFNFILYFFVFNFFWKKNRKDGSCVGYEFTRAI